MAFGQSPTDRDPVATLEALAARAGGGLEVDRYGGRELAERLERRVADLLGTEEAVWLPSGTMAQQIALRLHAERSGRRAVAFHPCCHVDVHEERGYEVLHGLRAAVIGERHRLLEPTDVEELGEPVAAVLLELPQRDLGGQLPAWEDLVATCAAARERGAALHLDGARLWQCSPFYDRPLAEVASLFDTVYVSFYKDLGAPAGCALGGSAELVAEARVWQVRHGGRLFTAFPFLLAAERGLDEVLPRMQELTARARESAAALAALDDVAVVPDPPHAAMLHALVRRPLEALNDAVLAVARETGTWPGGEFTATGDPGVQRIELGVSPANLEVPVDEIAELWRELLRRAEPDPA
jgi:threonine aldolase